MKNKILKIIGLSLIYICISVGIYFILRACGLTSVDKIRSIMEKAGAWGYILFFVFQVATSTFICIIPFEDEFLTACALILFGPIKGFIIGAINMFTTSCLQFLIGRKFCKSIVVKITGEKEFEKYENYLKIRGELMLPFLYFIPLLPHDVLCILAGMSKMKFWYFAPVTLIMRSIEIASICFLGSGLINYSALTVADWIIIANLIIVDIYLLCKLHKFIDKKIKGDLE